MGWQGKECARGRAAAEAAEAARLLARVGTAAWSGLRARAERESGSLKISNWRWRAPEGRGAGKAARGQTG